MLKIENTEVMGWEHAIRGMRNPKNSWEKSDSGVCATHGPAHCADCVYTDCHADDVEIGTKYILGGDNLTLMTTLRNAGTDHRKFMRMITVRLKGASKEGDAFGQIVEVAAPVANELDLFKAKNGDKANHELRIVEIEFKENLWQ